MSSKRNIVCHQIHFVIYVDTIYRLQATKTQEACVRARSLSLHTVLTLACLSATKTKHGLLMFALEVVGRRWKDGYEAK